MPKGGESKMDNAEKLENIRWEKRKQNIRELNH
jgi:hypothetical protein